MEHLDFILWTCLWPLCCAIGNWFSAKERAIEGKSPLSDKIESTVSFISFVIWVLVAMPLY